MDKKNYTKQSLQNWHQTLEVIVFRLKIICEETQMDQEFEPIILGIMSIQKELAHLYGEIVIKEKNIKKEKSK